MSARPSTVPGVSGAETDAPMRGIRVVSLAVNLPGPATAARLLALGASVTKVEPTAGDPLGLYVPEYYRQLAQGQHIISLDLKQEEARQELDGLLTSADLLITSSRPSALTRLGLGWPQLQARFPALCQVAIVGHPGPQAEVAGHDLTYQASAGTLQPPLLPTVLVADLAGAERATAEALAALLLRARTGRGVLREVALSDVAQDLAQPRVHGLTGPGGLLGGALPTYAVYPAAQGYVALAALEPHFRDRLLAELDSDGSQESLAAIFARRPAAEWEEWARDRDLPIAEVRGS